MSLDNFRQQIDQVDSELLALFEQRMDIVKEIAAIKEAEGLPVLDRRREAEKLRVIESKVRKDLAPYAHTLYDTLFELSRNLQSDQRVVASPLYEEIQAAIQNTPKLFPSSATVACQGVPGAYSEQAVERLFQRPNVQYCKSFESVFAAIQNGFCDYGVLPLENSTAGSVNKIYNLMQSHDFYIVRSLRLKVDHNLLAPRGVKLEDIREIFSHEQAIAQCAGYLEQFGPGVKITPCENTAAAAAIVAGSSRRDIAAISSHSCIELYGLSALAHDIQDRSNNYTRFICISRKLEIYPGADRTNIMLTTPHRPGALYKVLARFYALGINLNKLESRPLPDRDFQFMFYFGLETSVYSEEFAKLLCSLQDICDQFKYLGSYSEAL
ncbi:MAG: chorismate mutase [Oscillospiraceae bacterium]|nr:chorismate mutase [Oscillospiraceae bacterium]